MPKTRHVLGVSGGKDSAALAVFMGNRHPELDIEYFFTDTGNELPEVYDYLGQLEGVLGKEIQRLNPDRDFEFWWREYGTFLPSPQTRWCTRMLKIRPLEAWLEDSLEKGTQVKTYVAIRADEDRSGYKPTNPQIEAVFPFAESGIDVKGVHRILDEAGIGLPDYYKWRSRSGCTFCFYQQKIEWVRLRERHPKAFEQAMKYEKTALDAGSPFTWSQGESLQELAQPERTRKIKENYEERLRRMNGKKRLAWWADEDDIIDVDDVYGVSEGKRACFACHK